MIEPPEPPGKRGTRPNRTHTDGSPLGTPIKWDNEEKENARHAGKDPEPVKRPDEVEPKRKEESATPQP